MSRKGGAQTRTDVIINVFRYVILILIILVFVRLAQSAYRTGYSIFAQSGVDQAGSGRDVTVTVTSDMSVKEIGSMLEKAGLIEDAGIFPIQERFSAYHGQIQAGTYTLSTEMTPDEIIEAMATGSSASGASTESSGTAATQSSTASTSTESSGTAAAGTSAESAGTAGT